MLKSVRDSTLSPIGTESLSFTMTNQLTHMTSICTAMLLLRPVLGVSTKEDGLWQNRPRSSLMNARSSEAWHLTQIPSLRQLGVDIQLVNPALIPLISDYQSSTINSLSPSTLSSYWTAWKASITFTTNTTQPFRHSISSPRLLSVLTPIPHDKSCITKLTLAVSASFQDNNRLFVNSSLSPRRLPLNADLLLICLHTIRSGYGTPQVAQTLEAMFLLAFWFPQMLRIHLLNHSLRLKPSCLHF